MINPKKDTAEHSGSNAEKDPSDWVTGDEKMTGAQASYLKTLSEEAGEAFDDTLTKADARYASRNFRQKPAEESRVR